ncbi:MAG: 3-deoxy-D-manno-octulosonic acid transferase [Thermodesulfobacteriota bacterium]
MLVRVVYNLLLLVGVIVFAPILFVKVILTPRHRRRFLGRLGLGRWHIERGAGSPRIWVHALSVGEVASARPLLLALREAYADGCLILSTTTTAGAGFAQTSLAQVVDGIVPFPFDFPWSVNRAIDRVRPDLFILVETDYWPNLLSALSRCGVPAILVNGRVSARSHARYARFPWFFVPMFRSFRRLAMQTAPDAEAMTRLGVSLSRLAVLGNLKYEAAVPALRGAQRLCRADLGIPAQAVVWVAGSTHPGEEAVVLEVHRRLRESHPGLLLVIAPRDVRRREEVLALVARLGMGARCRSEVGGAGDGAVLLLDTLGELASVYGLCDVAFIGGSLVAERGHNPLEAAAHSKPVLFGHSMEDFSEIAHGLVKGGGGWQVVDGEELADRLAGLLADPVLRTAMGQAAFELVRQGQGATARHLAMIQGVLAGEGGDAAAS